MTGRPIGGPDVDARSWRLREAALVVSWRKKQRGEIWHRCSWSLLFRLLLRSLQCTVLANFAARPDLIKQMQVTSFLGVAWIALAAAQALPSTYNLSSVLSTQATLTTFTSYLNLFPALVSQVEPGNVTSMVLALLWTGICALSQLDAVLAPSNEAFSKYFDAHNATSNDTDKLGAMLSYHVLQGAFTRVLFNNTPLFIPTLLSDPRYANVTGGQRVEVGLLGGDIVFYSAVKAISKLTTPVSFELAAGPRISFRH